MIMRALFAVSGLCGFCLSLPAQETPHSGQAQPAFLALNQAGRSDVMEVRPATGQVFGALNAPYDGLPSLTLADHGNFSFPSSFAWVEAPPADFLPAMALDEPAMVRPSATPARDSGSKAVDLLPKFEYASGEVGVFYGKSTGKFGREVKQGYILGEVGDDKFHLTVGAAYQESSGRFPRLLGR